MSLYQLKPWFQALLRPAARTLHRFGITPNQVTLTACLISVGLGLWTATHADQRLWFIVIALWFLLRMMLNAIDGMLARDFDQASVLGHYLNEIGDVASDAALYLPFAFVAGSSFALTALVILLSAAGELAAVLGRRQASRRNDGPMGKSDRALVFGVVALMIGSNVDIGAALPAILSVVSGLLVLTIVNRIRRKTSAQI